MARIVTHLDGLLLMKSHESLITWSYEITWQTKTIICPLPQYLWQPNLPGWRLALSGSYHKVTWPLARWSYLDHMTIWKLCISTFTRLMAITGLVSKGLTCHQFLVFTNLTTRQHAAFILSEKYYFFPWYTLAIKLHGYWILSLSFVIICKWSQRNEPWHMVTLG